MTEEVPSITHDFSTPVDLLATFERLDIEALTADETRAFVIYWSTVLTLDVTEGDLTNAVEISIEVEDEGDVPPDVEPADLPTTFVTEIENAIS